MEGTRRYSFQPPKHAGRAAHAVHFLSALYSGLGAQAQVGGHLVAHPVPDRLIRIEVWAVARQVHQAQAQSRSRQVGPQGIAAMRRGIIPNHRQRSRVLLPQLPQESGGGCRVAVALQFQPFHLAGFQAHRRIIAGLFAPARAGRVHQGWPSFEHPFAPQVSIGPEVGLVDEENLGSHLLRLVHQGGILRHEGLPLGCVGFEQTLLGPFQHKSQAVQVIQATAAA